MACTLDEAPTDKAVTDWLKAKGIDPNDVTAYRVTRKAGDLATIELTMIFDKPKTEAGD
jgi:hypothetical protein